jgi:hypothetical protein
MDSKNPPRTNIFSITEIRIITLRLAAGEGAELKTLTYLDQDHQPLGSWQKQIKLSLEENIPDLGSQTLTRISKHKLIIIDYQTHEASHHGEKAEMMRFATHSRDC